MKLLRVSVAVGVLAAFAGCSLFSGLQADYSKGAVQMPALDIPPDLTRPTTVDTYKVPQVQAAASSVAAQSRATSDVTMQVGESGVNSILIKVAFDRGWRRVGLALDDLKLVVEDKDRSKGIYYLQAITSVAGVEIPREAGVAASTYRVHVQDGGMSSSVTVSASDGMNDAGSKVLLDALYQTIKP